MPEEQNKPRFEPPPWEREAFDRFQKERAQARAAEELDEAMRSIRHQEKVSEAAVSAEGALPGSAVPTEAATGAVPGQAQVPDREPEPGAPAISEARMDAMLIQLRAEELPAPPPNMVLINSACAVLGLTGLAIIVRAARLFAESQTDNAAATMLAATVSFVILMTGFGLLAGAVVLFRKYHR